MKVGRDTVVTIAYSLFDAQGELLERTEAPVDYLHGGYANVFPLVEAALEGKSAGDSVSVKLEPEDAFGDYDDELLRVEERSLFPAVLEVGMQFEGIPGEELGEDADIFTVTDIAEGKVVLDANHPLAGLALVFDCRIEAVRASTAEERTQGRAGAGIATSGSGYRH
jgi:FKBP-type peptidyl-prolyl cis-trans isomerase SlyD